MLYHTTQVHTFNASVSRKLLMLTTLMGLLTLAAGCHKQTADASDSDPHYYKGADFHGKPKKA